MKKGILILVFVFALSSVFAVVKITNTARCFFGCLVVAEKDIEKATGVEITMNDNCAGLDEGIKMVLEGKADIGTCARELTEEEKKAGLVSISISVDGIAVIVNKENPFEVLSSTDVLKIFAGKIKNWKELGGPDKKILILTQTCGASEENILPEWFSQYKLVPDTEYLAKATVSSEITDNLIAKVEKYTSCIAFVSPMFHSDKTKFIKVDGYLPTRENVLKEKYPFVRPMNLVVKGKPEGEVKKVVDYMTGPEGEKAIEKILEMDWLKEGF